LHVHIRHLEPAIDQLLTSGLSVGDDHLQALHRSWWRCGDPFAEGDRARGARGRELHEPQLIIHALVVVRVESDLVDVERFGTVDVGNGKNHQLKLPVHTALLRCDGIQSDVPGGDDNPPVTDLERAIRIALDAHSGQKYPSPEGEAYVLHPLRVMTMVSGSDAEIAAVLHDVIEDSDVTLEELGAEGFSPPVLQTLDCLTRRTGEPYTEYIERVSTDATAVEVKIADLQDNLRNNRRLIRTRDVDARIQRYESALASLMGASVARITAERVRGVRRR
jgi:hypothetical protein